ncbi:MAG: TldD/PmbA family protein [Elusimicrobia bacterium]|nr:TldD/PmbA family protein [Elusimicrobiota bacterium]
MELMMEEESEREISWGEGRAKNISSSIGAGGSVRVMKGGRQGFASGTDGSFHGIRALFERAVDSAKATFPDRARCLPRPFRKGSRTLLEKDTGGPRAGGGPCAPSWPFRSDLSDARSPQTLVARLKTLERRALMGDRRIKKALNLTFHEAGGVQAIVNTCGMAVAEPWSAVSFTAEILGASGHETETTWGSAERRTWAELNPESVIDDMRARLQSSFGARPLRSGGWPVIFSPRVGVDLVDFFSQTVLADAVQKGRSCLAGRMAKKVGSPLITMIDDGTRAGGLASGVWDDEGVPKQRTVVVEGGILRSFLYDTVTARRVQGVSTGNASRPGRDAPPSPGVTNFYLAEGPLSREALYHGTPRAFVVRDVIGMHTADSVSGDFSVGASGFLLEKGRPGHAVRGVTLSGNVLTLFSHVDAVADDLVWYGTFGAPTIRVTSLSVGGS